MKIVILFYFLLCFPLSRSVRNALSEWFQADRRRVPCSTFRTCFPARLKPIPPKLQLQLRCAGCVRPSVNDVFHREFGGQSLVNVLIADVGKSSNDSLTNISETFDNFNVAVTHATKSKSLFTRTSSRRAENPKRNQKYSSKKKKDLSTLHCIPFCAW